MFAVCVLRSRRVDHCVVRTQYAEEYHDDGSHAQTENERCHKCLTSDHAPEGIGDEREEALILSIVSGAECRHLELMEPLALVKRRLCCCSVSVL